MERDWLHLESQKSLINIENITHIVKHPQHFTIYTSANHKIYVGLPDVQEGNELYTSDYNKVFGLYTQLENSPKTV